MHRETENAFNFHSYKSAFLFFFVYSYVCVLYVQRAIKDINGRSLMVYLKWIPSDLVKLMLRFEIELSA